MGKCMPHPFFTSCQVFAASDDPLGRYGVILDAGSSGTRLHIYRWLDNTRAKLDATPKELASLPKLMTKKKWTKKIRPGVSTFGSQPSAVGEEHLKELLDHALSVVPESQIADTPLFLMATAGMRLLPPDQRSALLSEICAYAQETTSFSLPDCDLHIQVIPGETEGLYGWIAANYLLGGFDNPEEHAHGKGHHTYGFLDMGGASAQIAFAPNSTEAERHANDLKLLRMRTLGGADSEYKVFVATWLGFGVNEARHRYVEALQESSGSSAQELPDPCLPKGLLSDLNGEEISQEQAAAADSYLLGQGLFPECLRKTYPLLDKDAPCEDQPCLLNGQHVPAIDFDVNHFVGVSEYWHTTHGVFEMSHTDKAYDFNTYQQRVNEFCSQDWDTIEEGLSAQKYGKKADATTVMEVCFKASWLINVLHDGIGIPRVGLENTPGGFNGTKEVLDHAKEKGFLDPFQAVDKIGDTEVSWTLGKMVLYAAGQIKPRTEALPVGFGSNVASSTPPDFQYAGSQYLPLVPGQNDDDDDDDWGDTVDDMLKKAPRNSTSGVLIFLLLLILIGYIFRRQDRRLRLYSKVSKTFRASRRPGSPRKGVRAFFHGGKLFGRHPVSYERVLEDGDAANAFELRDAVDSDDNEHSDSSEGSRAARSSGLATPKLHLHGFSNESTYFDGLPPTTPGLPASASSSSSLHANGPGQAAGFNPMDRSGLMVRTESRERLGLSGRSRAGSPTRGKSPLMSPLDED
ncbi:MAG: Golgi apyrase [Claussenomyces sp. TS43310]|nr:MAG: Golgi apyrase [Claussenomyces sp. TS43310]